MLKMQIQRYSLLKYDRNPGEFVPHRVAVPLRQAALLHLAALCSSQGPTVIHAELSEGDLCPEHSLDCGDAVVKCSDFGALRILTRRNCLKYPRDIG